MKYPGEINKKIMATSKRGFTLIETLVAISILMLSITGPMVFASQGLQASRYARDQITAFYLTQDAFETIRNLRDNTAIKIQNGEVRDWDEAFSNCYGIICRVDSSVGPTSGDVIKQCTDADCILKQDPNTGEYGYVSGNTTTYKRTVEITKVNDIQNSSGDYVDEINVKVTIEWKSGMITKNFIANETMFNIYGLQ